MLLGGMPEVVQNYIDSNDLSETRKIQREIVDTYVLDFAKHAPASDIPKLSIIWDSIPAQLGKENKKFIFSAINKSARAREYENAIQWLEDAGLILRVNLVKSGINPRSKSMRVYMDKNKPDIFYRSTLLNLKKDGLVMNIPLYAISLFPQFIQP